MRCHLNLPGSSFEYCILIFCIFYVTEVSGQEAPIVSVPSSSAVKIAKDVMDADEQFVESALRSSQQLLQSLNRIDAETELSPSYDFDTQSGLSKRIETANTAQFERIQNYADVIQLQTAISFELWGGRVEDKIKTFIQTSTIDYLPSEPSAGKGEQVLSLFGPRGMPVPVPVAPLGGFFSQSQP